MDIRDKLIKGFPAIEKALPHLNQGGCLFFAYCLKQRLKELGVNAEIVAVGADFDDYVKSMKCKGINTAYRKSIKTKEVQDMPAPHFMVSLEGGVFDSGGGKPKSLVTMLTGISEPVSDKTAMLLLHHSELWNPMFKIHNEHVQRFRAIQVLLKRYLK